MTLVRDERANPFREGRVSTVASYDAEDPRIGGVSFTNFNDGQGMNVAIKTMRGCDVIQVSPEDTAELLAVLNQWYGQGSMQA